MQKAKSQRRGRPEKADKLSRAFNVACDEATYKRVETYRERQPRMSQSEAVRRLLEAGLAAEGIR